MNQNHADCGDDPGNLLVILAPSDRDAKVPWSAVCKRCVTRWAPDDDGIPDHVHEAVRMAREMSGR